MDMGPDRVAGFDHVFEDLVDNVFLEDAKVAVREQVFLPGLELEAAFAGHITELNNTEIGQAGLRADGSKFGIVDQNFIGRELILPGFNGGEIEVEAGLGMLFGIAGDSSVGNGCHRDIVGHVRINFCWLPQAAIRIESKLTYMLNLAGIPCFVPQYSAG